MGKKSAGQALLGAWASFIASFVAFPDVPSGQAVVAALWAMQAWFLRVREEDAARFPVTTYAHVRADAAGQGKSTLLEVWKALTPNARFTNTLRPLSVVRDIQKVATERHQSVTYLFDQIEALSASTESVDDGKSILLGGYRWGGDHVVLGTLYSTYCSKAFASIGDIAADDLRSRCIIFRLAFGVPARDWSDCAMTRDDEARKLVAGLAALFPDRVPAWSAPSWLTGRDREIWAPIWSVAVALDLDMQTMMDLRTSIDEFQETRRSAERRSYRDLMASASAVSKDQVQIDAERLLRDVVKLLPEPGVKAGEATGDVHTAWLLEALGQRGTWRVYRGKGLDANLLASYLSRFGASSNREVRMIKGRAGKVAKGYSGRELRAALAKVEGGE